MISSRFTAVLAAVAVAALAVPASAADPDTTPAAKAQEKKPLSRKALKLVWCVKPKDAAPDVKKECKTREAWIKEGKDPFGQY